MTSNIDKLVNTNSLYSNSSLRWKKVNNFQYNNFSHKYYTQAIGIILYFYNQKLENISSVFSNF